MKKTFVAFGIVVAMILGVVYGLTNSNGISAEDPMRNREMVEVNLGDAIDAYLEEESSYDGKIDNVTVMDRYYDADYDGEVAEVMFVRDDGYSGFAKIRVESVVDWFADRA